MKAIVVDLFNKSQQKMYYGVKYGSMWIDSNLRCCYMNEAEWWSDRTEAEKTAKLFNGDVDEN